jgi:hypothetical protein
LMSESASKNTQRRLPIFVSKILGRFDRSVDACPDDGFAVDFPVYEDDPVID